MEDGYDKPVAFASRTMSKAERNYGQVEKEGLSVVYGVKKFHQYLYGQFFEIWTDHKPLLGILGETKGIPERAASRIQRWALLLSGYNYRLRYRKGEDHGNADGVSRVPLLAIESEVSDIANEINMVSLDHSPVTCKEVKNATEKDVVLSRVSDFVLHGWPDEMEVDSGFVPYHRRKEELAVESGCVLWGSRVVIPEKLRDQVLQELHEGHIGMVRMKMLSRAFVWWPELDKDIEEACAGCEQCIMHQNNPSQTVHPWEPASKPWERLHIDYAGPYLGRMFLVLVDTFSKWLEVFSVPSASSLCTIEKLRVAFAAHGLPEVIVSDNGSAFTSDEFGEFVKRNGITHITSAPYHPASNGPAERTVQTFKCYMEKQEKGKCSIETLVSRFLFSYRNTPHSRTGLSPSELLMKRRPRTHLTSLKPDLQSKTQKSVKTPNHPSQVREFAVGDEVLARNYSGGNKWVKGKVCEKVGAVSYKIQIEGGIIRRHIDQVVRNSSGVKAQKEICPEVVVHEDVALEQAVSEAAGNVSESGGIGASSEIVVPRSVIPEVVPENNRVVSPGVSSPRPQVVDPVESSLRRSARAKKPPPYLADYTS